MTLTLDQVKSLAPDVSSFADGQKVAKDRSKWKLLNKNDRAVWGACQGSGKDPYQVRVDLNDYGGKCNCPSRKLPCKHVIGLLVIVAENAATVADGEPPPWVAEWLQGRVERAAKKEEKVKAAIEAANDPEEQAKRIKAEAKKFAERRKEVSEGLALFMTWMEDIVRAGLAKVEQEPPEFWDKQGRRLVDAKASGLGSRVKRLADVPGATPDWPQRLLEKLGHYALAADAFSRIDSLEPPLREDLKQFIGWNMEKIDVLTTGEVVADTWRVVGQVNDENDSTLVVQRSWLWGATSKRLALLLQFAVQVNQQKGRFEELLVPGTQFKAELAFAKTALPMRCLIKERKGPVMSTSEPLRGWANFEALFATYAGYLATQPWLEQVGGVVENVTPIPKDKGNWSLRDSTGATLPMTPGAHWKFLAFSGGKPLNVAVEWDRWEIRPLGVVCDGAYHMLATTA